MISLMFALIVSSAAVGPQAVQAQLQSCALESGRYVCRYAVPDIMIVPVPGTDIVADAPAVVLSNGSGVAALSPETVVPDAVAATIVTTESTTGAATASTTPPVTPAAVEAGPIRPIDAGVLTEREAQLVARCADAGWMSLCLPDDRRAARTLRDKQNAYQAVRRDVSRLLGADDCDAAVKAALDGGYLGLARETRDYCAAPTATSALANPITAAASAPVEATNDAEAPEDTEDAEAGQD